MPPLEGLADRVEDRYVNNCNKHSQKDKGCDGEMSKGQQGFQKEPLISCLGTQGTSPRATWRRWHLNSCSHCVAFIWAYMSLPSGL